MPFRFSAITAGYSAVLAALVFGPLFGSGYLLLRDAVSTPRSFLTDSALGLTDAAPRAVPQDALVATLSSVVDGGLVVKALLFGALWLAGWGAAELARRMLDVGIGPALVAATVAVWNPYVAERLLQGHWSLLIGYAALPWTVCACLAIRSGGAARAWWGLALCLGAAGITPTGVLLACVVALVTLRRPVAMLGAVILTVAASAPWLVASAQSGAGSSSDPAAIAAFAARGEPGLGTLGSLAGLGGIWNSEAVPNSRTSLFALFGTVLLLAVVLCGVPALLRGRDRTVRALLVLALVAVLLPALAATGWGLDAGEWAVRRLPGFGLLRDTQKWVCLALPAYLLGAAAGARWLSGRIGAAAPVLAISAILVALPDLGWGVGGQLRPVHYPDSWREVAARVHGPGDVAVLPAGMFRSFSYSERGVAVLDPAPRMLDADVLQTGALPVAGGTVDETAGRAADVKAALLHGSSPDDLASRGVGWVLVERDSKGPMGASSSTLAQLRTVYSDGHLALYRVDDVIAQPQPTRGPVIAAHVVWAGLLAGGALGLLVLRRRRGTDQA